MAENKPEATAATAQTQLPEAPRDEGKTYHCEEDGVSFRIGPGVERAARGRPYERRAEDEPLFRPLRIFALDPSQRKFDGAVATLKVPYEPLEPGPVGSIFEVDNFDGFQHNRRVDLDDRFVLISDGLEPNPSDPRFHQQMVYAVGSSVYAAFRTALGRHIAWGFEERPGQERTRLRLCPHGFPGENAFYDKEAGEIRFGFFPAHKEAVGRNLPKGWVFTCLSHDIVVHELTHALLDGLRAHFTLPTGPDVLAFHEAFADLIAIFQRFSYEAVVKSALRKARGNLRKAAGLTEIGTQFGETTREGGRALRSALDRMDTEREKPLRYDEAQGRYQRASVLVAAVFEAFATIFARKTKPYRRLATNGTGVLPEGDLPPLLLDLLASKASRLASQFLSIAIRAIDYCPPVDVTFGEYLRALITADRTLVPDDPWDYREALVDAFRARGIFPEGVDNLSEQALLWRAPLREIPVFEKLTFGALKFQGDPSVAAGRDELRRQACELGRLVTRSDLRDEFGLSANGDPRLEGDRVDLPVVHSIRSTRRVGPESQIVFDLIAEVTQRRTIRSGDNRRGFDFYGGSTIVINPEGKIRYVISKNIAHPERVDRQREFLRSPEGVRFWQVAGGKLSPKRQLFKLLHEEES
jgi:hypothetical protein